MVATFTCPICLSERVCPNVADDNEILADKSNVNKSDDNCNTEGKQDIVVLGNEHASKTIQDPQSAQIVAADHAERNSGHDVSESIHQHPQDQLFSAPSTDDDQTYSDHVQDDIDDQNSNSVYAQDIPSAVTNQKNGDEIFELSSCNHKFCTPCLRAYVRSKLLDGIVDIPCCHFGKLSSLEDDFHPCNVLLEESDIYNLIHTRVDDFDESNNSIDEWCCGNIKDDDNKCNTSNIKRGDELWTKYQKLKFDTFHGKNAVRRCPHCDHAQLFDEDSMKQYQTTYLTNTAAQASVAGDASNAADNMNFLERVCDALRQRHRNNAGGSREDTDANTHEQGDVNEEIKSGRGNISNATTSEAAVHQSNNDNSNNNSEGRLTGGAETCGAQQVLDSDSNAKIDAKDKEQTQEAQMDASSSIVAKSDEYKETEVCSRAKDKANELGTCICVECKEPEQNELLAHLGKSTTPIVACQKCNTDFCYFHSNAHAGNVSSCIEYHNKSLEADRANIEYAANTLRAKPCPTCGISVSKEGGCNQMKCGSCGTHFCWLCGEIVGDGPFPEHFRWWNLQGCANMQLDENDRPLRCTLWGAKLLSILQIIVLGVPAVVLTLLSIVLCPCCVVGTGATNRERVINMVSFWGSFMSSVLFLPFTCLGLLLLSMLYCFVATITLFVKALKPRGMRGGNSNWSVDNAAIPSRDATSRNVSAGNTPEDLLRELNELFSSMEEGFSPASE